MGMFNEVKNVTNIDSFEKLDENNKPIKKDENVMDLVFLLDKSGSMWNLEDDTIGGFNSYIAKERQKEGGAKILVTLVLFNDEYRILYSRKPIEEVKELTNEDYYTEGCTALLDAIGTTITSLDEEVSDKVLFVITTDGLENSSQKYNKAMVKELIESHKWEFLFIGADIDSYGEALTLGIDSDHAANFEKSSRGLGCMFDSVRSYRCAFEKGNEEITRGRGWKEGLD